jgi:hypothetical protein
MIVEKIAVSWQKTPNSPNRPPHELQLQLQLKLNSN